MIVRLAAGSHPRAVWAAALDSHGKTVFTRYFAVLDDGTARLSSLPAGRFELVVATSGAGTVRQPVQVPGDPVEMTLPPATRVEVRVPELAGTVELATLAITDPQGRPFVSISSRPAVHPVRQWTVREGRASIDDLPPGRWDVTVTSTRGESWRGSLLAPPQGGEVLLELD